MRAGVGVERLISDSFKGSWAKFTSLWCFLFDLIWFDIIWRLGRLGPSHCFYNFIWSIPARPATGSYVNCLSSVTSASHAASSMPGNKITIVDADCSIPKTLMPAHHARSVSSVWSPKRLAKHVWLWISCFLLILFRWGQTSWGKFEHPVPSWLV